jgi:thiol-disulfide isomerase/thioredoxin
MMKGRNRRVSGLAGVLLMALIVGILGPIALAEPPAWAGQPQPAKVPKAPEFSTWDTLGLLRNLSDFLGKKPVLLEFMSLGCPYCLEMAPILGRIHATYGDRVQFLTVVFDPDAKRIQKYAQKEKHTWPYLVGTQPIIDAYTLQGVPTLYFLLKDGRVFRNHAGSLSEKALQETLDALLKAR